MRIEVLVFEGCPHAGAAMALVRDVAARLLPAGGVDRIDVDTPERAEALGFLGSPSVRVNGEDIERRSTSQGALCCRSYSGEGVPPEWMLPTISAGGASRSSRGHQARLNAAATAPAMPRQRAGQPAARRTEFQ